MKTSFSEPLLRLDQRLNQRAAQLKYPIPDVSEYENLLSAFAAAGARPTREPESMRKSLCPFSERSHAKDIFSRSSSVMETIRWHWKPSLTFTKRRTLRVTFASPPLTGWSWPSWRNEGDSSEKKRRGWRCCKTQKHKPE